VQVGPANEREGGPDFVLQYQGPVHLVHLVHLISGVKMDWKPSSLSPAVALRALPFRVLMRRATGRWTGGPGGPPQLIQIRGRALRSATMPGIKGFRSQKTLAGK